MNITYDISNHPEFPEITRKVLIRNYRNNIIGNELWFEFAILHYKDIDVKADTIPDIIWELYGTNNHRVYGSDTGEHKVGDIIDENSVDWITGIPEYDFLVNIPNQQQLTEFLGDMKIAETYIARRDKQNHFGKQIYIK